MPLLQRCGWSIAEFVVIALIVSVIDHLIGPPGNPHWMTAALWGAGGVFKGLGYK